MTKVAAEASDGLIMHPFSTEQYIREVNLPAIEQGLAVSGLSRKDYEIDYAPMIATGDSEEDINKGIEVIKDRLAFYGSTPGYRSVLELHGWGELQTELNFLMKQRRQDEMAGLISDEVLHAFAIIGEPEAVADEIVRRFSGLVDRTSFVAPGLSDDRTAEMLVRLRGG